MPQSDPTPAFLSFKDAPPSGTLNPSGVAALEEEDRAQVARDHPDATAAIIEQAGRKSDALAGSDPEPFVRNEFGALKQAKRQRYDLLPWEVLDEVTEVLGAGAAKYEPHNWRKGFDYGAVLSSACHHISAVMRGEDIDPETGKLHSAHAICQLMFLCSFQLTGAGNDDRYPVRLDLSKEPAAVRNAGDTADIPRTTLYPTD